ncbi:MAG: hypothetical protein K2P58_07410 [Hyphomonadaceae bacterium]|nr:hypothetical protein [Hyphomonadaceae bacterium]
MKRAKKVKRSTAAGRGKPASFSTSQGRANIKRALEITDREKTVVGFARYRTTIAALVPVEAVYMLAGQGGDVEPGVHDHITKMSKLFVAGAARSAPAPAPAKRAKKAAVKKKAAKRKKSGKRKAVGKSRPNGL